MITVNDKEITSFNFSGGEVYVKCELEYDEEVVIIAQLQNSDDIMKLLMTTDSVKRQLVNPKIILIIPYLPYARQDKIVEIGESLSLKVFCDLINAQNYHRVVVFDVHSDTAKALLERSEFVEQSQIITKFIDFEKFDYLVSPDFGASKKIYKTSQISNVPIIQANKVRSGNGDIINTELYCGKLTDKSVLIIDDICDGGRTFIEIAKVLKDKDVKSISLYVTHGIFSKGLDCLFEAGIDFIYTTDSFKTGFVSEKLFTFKLGE